MVFGRKMAVKHHIEVEGRELAISNMDKIYYPESVFTKGEVISFYSEIAEVILPYLRNRPLTLKRFPVRESSFISASGLQGAASKIKLRHEQGRYLRHLKKKGYPPSFR
jgi:DNA primase